MFPDIVVEVSLAVICFTGQCHPALIGSETPRGAFQIQHYTTSLPGYGGDLLVFKERGNDVYAIHRVIDVPGQRRLERLKNNDVKDRQTITAGCINVNPEVFDLLVECCHASKVTIR